jgi:hypothetical protein
LDPRALTGPCLALSDFKWSLIDLVSFPYVFSIQIIKPEFPVSFKKKKTKTLP